MKLDQFEKRPLMGILRGVKPQEIAPLIETIISAGLSTIEITMNTPGAPELIRQLVECADGRLIIGAGTVLSSADMTRALAAGATFIVMPILVPDVMQRCVAEGVPVFPGALTPEEIYRAHAAGAAMVKVFPANCFGPAYFRDISGPFADIPLLACGGVNAKTVGAFFRNGARAAAFGGSIFKREWMEAGAFDRIGAAVADLVAAYRAATQSKSDQFEQLHSR
jgi:2-dehydro-3-deoxyphosphogluconate aldolase / (4S)-4-hydroxy-2-oxoglutarate aldolase